MKWAFAGTPQFADSIFLALLEAGHTPECVLTQPDRPAGRGLKLQASPVKKRALEKGISVLQPQSLKNNQDILSTLENAHLDVLIVVAYGLIIPSSLLALPAWGCWNVHASLLPRWRGAAPIHRAIQAGDKETGVAIMHMEAGLDTGPVYHQRATPILETDSTGDLSSRLAQIGAEALLEVIQWAQEGHLPEPVQQSEEGIVYAEKIHPEEARLNWRQPAEILHREIRAFNPHPGAWTLYKGERFKIWEAELWSTENGANKQLIPGDLISVEGEPCVVCGNEHAVLKLKTVQRAGTQRTSALQWWKAEELNCATGEKRLV